MKPNVDMCFVHSCFPYHQGIQPPAISLHIDGRRLARHVRRLTTLSQSSTGTATGAKCNGLFWVAVIDWDLHEAVTGAVEHILLPRLPALARRRWKPWFWRLPER